MLWSYDFKSISNCMTPVISNGRVFVGNAYGDGSALIHVTSPNSVREVYQNRNLRNFHGGVVLIDGYLYGSSGTSDGPLVCMNMMTGEVAWKHRSVGMGAVTYADGRLYYRGDRSKRMALIEATPEGYREHGRFLQPDSTHKPAWPHPVIANGRMYLRDQHRILAYDVREK